MKHERHHAVDESGRVVCRAAREAAGAIDALIEVYTSNMEADRRRRAAGEDQDRGMDKIRFAWLG
jgi:hypothetical protein